MCELLRIKSEFKKWNFYCFILLSLQELFNKMISKKIKVCHLTSVHQRNDVRIFYKQCKGLSKHYDVSLIVADGLGDALNDGVKIKDVGKPNNRFYRIKAQ